MDLTNELKSSAAIRSLRRVFGPKPEAQVVADSDYMRARGWVQPFRLQGVLAFAHNGS